MDVKIAKVLLTELKPGHSYIIGLNDQQVKKMDAVALAGILNEEGFGNVVIMTFHGDPSTGMVVVEKKDDGTTQPA